MSVLDCYLVTVYTLSLYGFDLLLLFCVVRTLGLYIGYIVPTRGNVRGVHVGDISPV